MSKELSTIEKRIAKNKEILLAQLNKIPIVQLACEKSNISRATYYRWKKDDQEFSRLVDEAIDGGVSIINDMAESKLISNIKDGNMTAIIYWLKNRHKAYSTRIEFTGTLEHKNGVITEDYKNLIEKALEISLPEQEDTNEQ